MQDHASQHLRGAGQGRVTYNNIVLSEHERAATEMFEARWASFQSEHPECGTEGGTGLFWQCSCGNCLALNLGQLGI